MDYSRIKKKTLTKDELELAASGAESGTFTSHLAVLHARGEDDRTTAREKDEGTHVDVERTRSKRTREE